MYCVWTVGSSLSKLKNRKEQRMDFIFNLLNEIHVDMEQEKSTSSRKGDCQFANLYTYISNPGSLRIRVLHFIGRLGE